MAKIRKALFVFLCLLLCVLTAGPAVAVAGSGLEGKWQAFEATSNGEPPPPGMLQQLTLVFRGETLSIMGAPPSRFTVDESFSPAHIDLLNSLHQVGIYELKGDVLRVCFGIQGDRPKAFHTENGTNRTFIALKRVKG
jgi:uncharacterized protein (TIGR03067 family)